MSARYIPTELWGEHLIKLDSTPIIEPCPLSSLQTWTPMNDLHTMSTETNMMFSSAQLTFMVLQWDSFLPNWIFYCWFKLRWLAIMKTIKRNVILSAGLLCKLKFKAKQSCYVYLQVKNITINVVTFVLNSNDT